MDETTLRTLLDSALADEPPIGPVADNALRAGIRLRRRRVLSVAGSVAVAVAIAVVIPAAAGPLGTPPASRQHPASTRCIHLLANIPPPTLAGPPASTQHPASTLRRRRPPTPPVLPAAAVNVMGRSAPRTQNGIICGHPRQ
jgi:hypothetical protein